MPLLASGLYSFAARGTLNKELVYFIRDGKQITRKYFVPVQPNTEKQLKQRLFFSVAHSQWQFLELQHKDLWNIYRKKNHIPGRYGYHWFISRFIDYLVQSDGVLPQYPFLPSSPKKINGIIRLGGDLDGDVSLLEQYNAHIEIIARHSNLVKSIVFLENNQDMWISSPLYPGEYIVNFIADTGSAFIPNYQEIPEHFTPGTYEDINRTFQVTATAKISGSLTGDTEYLGNLGCSIGIWNISETTLLDTIVLENNQTSWISNAQFLEGSYSIIAYRGSMNSVSPESYLDQFLSPPTDLSFCDFEFAV